LVGNVEEYFINDYSIVIAESSILDASVKLLVDMPVYRDILEEYT